MGVQLLLLPLKGQLEVAVSEDVRENYCITCFKYLKKYYLETKDLKAGFTGTGKF